ncbi:hypothetical protein Hypma_003028 [Hypsizygus marmoreus]|uniref:F-box domain-containing protein n=1 Tax=Hypsizygus marmoreus TaxID=39966 RepID=A0A369J2K4_HYPMA|nr:hypothetical protein Hypma_003028 [Hypsizygus marmoreus]
MRLEEPHRSLIATTLGLPSMTSFNLMYCELPSGVIDIHYLLLHATALKSLTIACEDTSQGSVDFSTLEQANQWACLEELMLDVSSLQYFMEWALHPRNCVLDLRGLRGLEITNIGDPTRISKLLVTLGATLERVRLYAGYWGDTEAYLDFSLCRQLCSLDINLAFAAYLPRPPLPPWLANCLQTIPPTTSLCRVIIRMAILVDEDNRTSYPPYLDALRSAFHGKSQHFGDIYVLRIIDCGQKCEHKTICGAVSSLAECIFMLC